MATNEEYQALIDSLSGECERLHKAINNIRAEIEQHTDGNNHCDEYLDGYNNGMKDALEIIDKYR